MDLEKSAAGASAAEPAGQEFFFPEGMLGFSSRRHFILGHYRPADGSVSPFFLLQAKDADLCFPLVSPDLLASDYRLAPPPELLAKLGAAAPEELAVFAVVTLRDRLEQITVNLQGPILLNPASGLGLQFVAEQFPLRYPLIRP